MGNEKINKYKINKYKLNKCEINYLNKQINVK